jgi:hypothetical protein
MMQQILIALGSERYSQHSICLTSDPVLMTLYIWGDGITFLSYFSIGIVLLLRAQRGNLSPVLIRPSLLPLYGAFIFLCGLSHLTEILTLFWGIYRLDVFITAAMASVSGVTAYYTVLDFYEEVRTAGG